MNKKTVTFDLARFGGVRALAPNRKRRLSNAECIDSALPVPSVPRDRGIVYSRSGSEGKSKERTIEFAGDTRDSRGQRAIATPLAKFRFVGSGMEFGDVCQGWCPASWAEELRRKAECCVSHRPDIADQYRNWACDIERRLTTGSDTD